MYAHGSIYTVEETRRFKLLLSTFKDYIEAQSFFELFYSEKLGAYFEVIMEDALLRSEPISVVETPDRLFLDFVIGIAADLAAPRLKKCRSRDAPDYDLAELSETRRRTEAYLSRMPDQMLRRHYTAIMEDFITEETAKAEHPNSELRRQAI